MGYQHLSSTDRRVYHKLKDIAGNKKKGKKEKTCYASLDYLSLVLGIHYTTVSRSVKRLKDSGLIQIRRRRYGSNIYVIQDTIHPDESFFNKMLQLFKYKHERDSRRSHG